MESADLVDKGAVVAMPETTTIEPKRILASDLSPTALSPAEIEAAFDYSMSLVRDDKKANVIAAKAMAYAAREEFTRAHEIVTQSRYKPTSRANELNTVKALIERNLTAPMDFL